MARRRVISPRPKSGSPSSGIRAAIIYQIANEIGEPRATVAHVLEELGLKDILKKRYISKYSEEQRTQAIELMRETNPDGSARYSIERVSEKTGLSTGAIRGWCDKAGLERRGRFTPMSARVDWAKSPEVRQQVIDLFRDNVPVKEIERLTGCAQNTINRFVREAGLPSRRGSKEAKATGGAKKGRAVWDWSMVGERVASEPDATPVQHDPL